MDIHPPEGPTHSFRDFLIHIGVVTIGILIALALETVTEAMHNRHVVREARQNFAEELRFNRGQLDKELKNDDETLALLDGIVAALPALRAHPEQLAARVAGIRPSGYFLVSSRWETALSTGALGHMSVDEVNRYAQVNFIVHEYTTLQTRNGQDWDHLEAYFSARPNLTPAESEEGIERLMILRTDTHGLVQVGYDMDRDLKRAMGAQ